MSAVSSSSKLKFQNDPSRYLICGTNAYKPQCREYLDERGSYTARGGSERSGIGVAPFSYKVKLIMDSMITFRFSFYRSNAF